MNERLLNKDVQAFISSNYGEDIAAIIFKGSPFEKVSTQELATQLSGKKKAEKKLPHWFATKGIIYPPGLNLEQTSSEKTAAYKASLINGRSLADLTGGFGVDSYFFSRQFQEVCHFELDPELSELVAHNAVLLGASNIRTIAGDAIEYLKESNKNFDWIYLDPARRDRAGGRVFHLSDCLPNVPEHLDLLLERSENILIKTSPLLDLAAGISALGPVKEIHIIALNNEVKELLWILRRNNSEAIRLKTINFRKTGADVYEKQSAKTVAEPEMGTPLSYLYEPNAAIMKSGLFAELALDFELRKLHPNTHLFTSEEKKKTFPGRRFRVLQSLPYKKKKIRSQLDFDKAHIAVRNFPDSVEKIRKHLKLGDGGEHYLFFTTTENNKKVVLHCKKE